MNLLDYVTAVRRRTGDFGGEQNSFETDWVASSYDDEGLTYSNAEIVSYVVEAQKEFTLHFPIEDRISDYTTLTLVSGVADYKLHDNVIRLGSVVLASTSKPLDRIQQYDSYDHTELSTVKYYQLIRNNNYLRVFGTPSAADTLTLEVFRHPKYEMSWDDKFDEPEIDSQYHEYLLDWVMFRCYEKVRVDEDRRPEAMYYLNRWEQRVRPQQSVQTQEVLRTLYDTGFVTRSSY